MISYTNICPKFFPNPIRRCGPTPEAAKSAGSLKLIIVFQFLPNLNAERRSSSPLSAAPSFKRAYTMKRPAFDPESDEVPQRTGVLFLQSHLYRQRG
ncbi:hypothetical protein CDAR_218431 [Caerostris darwini]|uniref:Uncharacterized protein n=1 Tax=Caerostris darwini TaxID=1538125 RepID=A0AAV4REF4_9ARAC|nr:hypothetical protein CDAR_218431 [Caerostris darwini]